MGLASIGEILKQLESRRGDNLKQSCEALRHVRKHLVEQKIETVIVAYDGYGDSGAIESITAYRDKNKVELGDELTTAIREAAYGILPGGWDVDCGSLGELVINVRLRTITREHNWRVEDTQYEERSILF